MDLAGSKAAGISPDKNYALVPGTRTLAFTRSKQELENHQIRLGLQGATPDLVLPPARYAVVKWTEPPILLGAPAGFMPSVTLIMRGSLLMDAGGN